MRADLDLPPTSIWCEGSVVWLRGYGGATTSSPGARYVCVCVGGKGTNKVGGQEGGVHPSIFFLYIYQFYSFLSFYLHSIYTYIYLSIHSRSTIPKGAFIEGRVG